MEDVRQLLEDRRRHRWLGCLPHWLGPGRLPRHSVYRWRVDIHTIGVVSFVSPDFDRQDIGLASRASQFGLKDMFY